MKESKTTVQERESVAILRKKVKYFHGSAKAFPVKKQKKSSSFLFTLKPQYTTHTLFSESLSFDFSFFRLKTKKENKVRNVKNLSTYRHTLPKYCFSSSNLGSLSST